MSEAMGAYHSLMSGRSPEKKITERLVKKDGRKWKSTSGYLEGNDQDACNRDLVHRQDISTANAFSTLFSELRAAGIVHVVRSSSSSPWAKLFEEQFLLCASTQHKRTKTARINRESTAPMEEDKRLSVRDMVGCEFCVAAEDGQRVYERIRNELRSGVSVSLSFQGVRNISAVFLHLAIGQLHNGDFSEEDITRKLNIVDISPERLVLIERTAQRAKEFFEDPSLFVDRES